MIDYRLLGPIEAGVDGRVLDVAGHKQLALLAVLVLRANQPVSRDVLVDWLWGEHPPPGVQHTLDVHISRLRKTLESAAGQQVVLTRPGAYLLRAAADSVDMRRFERLAEEGHRALAENAPDRAAADLSAALALWRGAPLADVSDEAFAQPEIARLNDLRMGIIEDRIEADLALGRHGGVVSELGALVAEHPLRERLYQLLMVALYRCGRQSEALAVYQQARRALVDELGIEPSPALQRIERAILAQDGSLDPPPRPAPALAPGQAREAGFPRTATVRRARLTTAIGASLALILAVVFLGGRPQTPPVSAAPDTVAVINASRDGLTSVVAGIGRPGGIAYGAGAAWVADTADGMLLRIKAGQVIDRIPVGRGPAGVVAGAGEIWVANAFDNTVSEVNPRTGTVVAPPIGVGGGPAALAYGYGSVWAANVTDATLSRIDPGSGTVTATIPLGSTPDGVAAGARGIWVASVQAGRLVLVDPRRGRVTRSFPVGGSPNDVAVGAGSVWFSDAGGTVARLNPVTGSVQRIKVGGSPAAIAFADGAVWVACSGLGSVFRIDPRTRVVRSVRVGNEPSGLAAAGGNVLVTVLPSLASHRGGTLTMVSSLTVPAAGLGSSDPALAWNLVTWQMLAMTNDGLVGFRRVGGPAGDQLVPDLARYLPVPAGNGTTYTFRLRAGIRYSNGQPVRPEDFRRPLERAFILNHGGLPASYFYSGIVGAAACERHPQGCTLSRGIVTNDRARTVTFHLTAPDPDFLDKLALPFADAVPAGTPDHQLNPAQIPATGPYLTRSLNPIRAWVLVRNPRFRQWSAQAQPGGYPDRIILQLGVAPAAAVDAVEHGRADVLPGPPVSRIHQLTTRYANLLHTDPVEETNTLFLNTRVRPFSVLAARQAVNYAIDRNTMIQLAGGPTAAQPTCQILPPTLPGYQPYCPYTINPGPSGAWQAPDLARAQQLARRSGTLGDKVTLVTGEAGMPGPAAGRYLVSVLRKIGYRASLRTINPQTYLPTVGNSRDRVQAGEFIWEADYPAPWDFFGLLFSCQAFLPGNPGNANDSEFCSPLIDAQVRQALADQAPSPNAARLFWANIDREITRQAPWVPLYNPRALIVLASRVGNYQFHPLFGLLVDQLWVR